MVEQVTRGARRIREAAAFVDDVASLLRLAGFTVTRDEQIRGQSFDLYAERTEIGRTKRYAIEVKYQPRPVGIDLVQQEASSYASLQDHCDEFWIIANGFSRLAREFVNPVSRRSIRLFTFDELEHALGVPPPRARRPGTARTVAGQAILANEAYITITSAALLLLIDERLATLREEKPNSDEMKAQKDDAIAQYERLKKDVQAMAQMASDFKSGAANEKAAVKASKSFAEGLQSWWTKGHEKIVQSAYDVSLFGTAVAICSMAGSGGKVAAAVSAALVGGKQLGAALRGLKGLWQ
jgi:hypothetical protein